MVVAGKANWLLRNTNVLALSASRNRMRRRRSFWSRTTNETGGSFRRLSWPLSRRPASARVHGPNPGLPEPGGSQRTPRWREQDSNPRSPLGEVSEYEISRQDREIAVQADG